MVSDLFTRAYRYCPCFQFGRLLDFEFFLGVDLRSLFIWIFFPFRRWPRKAFFRVKSATFLSDAAAGLRTCPLSAYGSFRAGVSSRRCYESFSLRLDFRDRCEWISMLYTLVRSLEGAGDPVACSVRLAGFDLRACPFPRRTACSSWGCYFFVCWCLSGPARFKSVMILFRPRRNRIICEGDKGFGGLDRTSPPGRSAVYLKLTFLSLWCFFYAIFSS